LGFNGRDKDSLNGTIFLAVHAASAVIDILNNRLFVLTHAKDILIAGFYTNAATDT
jgi:hypothetical protein